MIPEEQLTKGAEVCVLGWGNVQLHRHMWIRRVTMNWIVLTDGRRYHRHNQASAPATPYGGTTISLTCQESPLGS